jgi:hypothetical protein
MKFRSSISRAYRLICQARFIKAPVNTALKANAATPDENHRFQVKEID